VGRRHRTDPQGVARLPDVRAASADRGAGRGAGPLLHRDRWRRRRPHCRLVRMVRRPSTGSS
jgi:hypothetical protein